jgi:parallel beta-helix repeat protein
MKKRLNMKMPNSIIALIVGNLILQTNFVLAKVLAVPDEFATINQAISSATGGDTIKIRPGIYKENITLKSDVNIFGDDSNEVIIRCDSNKIAVADIQNCRNVILTGLTFTHGGEGQPAVEGVNNVPILRIRNSSVKVSHCRILNGVGDGIAIYGINQSEISECNVVQNALNGIIVLDNQSRPIIRKNFCSSNRGNGILFGGGAGGEAEDNIFSRNKNNGISVVQSLTSPKVTRNDCLENENSGIWIGYGARGEYKENKCISNGLHGISVTDAISTPLVQNNRCTENKGCGIYYIGFATDSVWPNIVKNNGQIDSLTLRQQLQTKKFDELEETADKLRTEKNMFSTGTVQLDYFYSTLSYVSPQQGQLNADKTVEVVNDWIIAKPDSVTPRIVLASIYANLAWQARGGGWGHDVSEDAGKVFSEQLKKAWEVLGEAEKLKQHDPELYRIFMKVGMGLSKSEWVMNKLFEKGIAIDKGYYPLYNQRSLSLMPRWGGKNGQLRAFAQRAAQLNKGEAGEIIYARLVAHLLPNFLSTGGESFDDIGFSCELARKGHENILKKYPKATFYLNSYCLLSCFCRDKDMAKTLFDRIGDNWDRDIWRKDVHFNSYRNWAYGRARSNLEPIPDGSHESDATHGQPTQKNHVENIPLFFILAAGTLAAFVFLGMVTAIIVLIIILILRRKNKQTRPR